jgi:murein L,D-transpeptidase YafK
MQIRRVFAAAIFSIASAILLVSLSGASPTTQVTAEQKADSILILKKDHTLQLLSNGKVIRTYKVALGRGGLAPKQREGDDLTPEGHYLIDSRNASSHFYKALHVSYPSSEDRKRATKLGVPPGGAIMIHGLPNGWAWIGSLQVHYDWTAGCIAVTDPEMDEIWNMVPIGTPVEIRP